MSSAGTTGNNAANAAGTGGTGSTNNNNPRRRWPARNSTASSTTQIINSIPGLEKAIFDFGPHVKPDQFQKSRIAVETHIQSTFKDPRDIIEAIRTLARPAALTPPTAPAARDPLKPEVFEIAIIEYKYKFEDYHRRSSQYTADEARAWAIIYGQCTASLRTQLEGTSTFQQCRDSYDVIELLTMIERLSSRLGEKQHSYFAVAGTFRTLCMYYQPDGMTNDDYYHHFKSMVRVITKFAGEGAIGYLPTLASAELLAICTANGTTTSSATSAERQLATSTAQEKFCAALMLSGANIKKYKTLKTELSNSFALGTDNYPPTMEGVLDLLNNYTTHSPTRSSPSATTNASRTDAIEEQAMFAQEDSPIVCRDCNQPGHAQRNCPRRRNNRRANDTAATPAPAPAPAASADEQVHAMISLQDSVPVPDDASYDEGTIFAQNTSVIVAPHKILLDNQSTINQFASADLLTDIGPAERPVRVHSNAGSTVTSLQGNFGDIEVYYDENGIANVLSLRKMAKRHRVTYDSWDRDGVFIVHTPSGPLEFAPTDTGLHELDLSSIPHTDVAAMLVNTVADNYEGYTKREVLKAHEARRFQRMIGCPSTRDYQGMVREKLIANCPVSITDVHNANQIFGPDLANLRGKTVRRKPEHVVTDYVDIPRDFLDRHRNVTLTADVMFVNGLPFLITSSRGINLVTIEFATTRTAPNLCKLVQRVISIYAAAGLKIQTVMMDMEFQPLQELMPNIVVNTTAANEHVAEIERRIRVVKERTRAIINTLPYPKLPKRMVVELLYFVTMWMNSFPVKGGISQKWSPRELLKRHRLDARLHCKAEFGAYCEVHDEPSPTNTMQRRTHAAICLGPTGNLQGSYKFFCLSTGRKLTRRSFTVIPGVPQTIINAVTKFATKENRTTGLIFRNRVQEPFAFSNDDLEDVLIERPAAPFPDIPNELPGVTTAVTILEPTPPPAKDDLANAIAAEAGINFNQPPLPLDDDDFIPPPALIQPDDNDILPGPQILAPLPQNNNDPHVIQLDDGTTSSDSSTSSDDPNDDTTIPSAPEDADDDDNDNSDDDDTNNQAFPTARPQRQRAGKNSKFDDYHLFTTAAEQEHPMHESTLATVCHFLMVHYSHPPPPTRRTSSTKKKPNVFSLSAGLKRFGEKGEAAVSKELHQFNMLNTFTPLDAQTLTYEQRRTALASLIFLTEKRNGDIKARACANGKPQREHIAKEETASPTVTTEANFALAAIAAHERRFVGTMDLPGAFLHANNDTFVIMKLTGKLAELMVKTAPNIYRKYVIEDSTGKPILYVQLQKALYGMLRSALLFYRKLVSDLTTMGFILNPYDPCVANKIVNGHQLTVSWHVDDLTISCVEEAPIHHVIQQLKNIYGQNLKEHIGPIHDYLGMKFDYTTPGQVEISMDNYIANIIDSFPEHITGVSATPATDKLFLVRDDDRPLPEDQAIMFHHVTAQLLFVSTRVRRDIQTTVAFLTTRVKQPGEDDWGKLKRVLKYLNGTRHLHLTLTVDSLSSIKWYVDGSHQIHDDCKGHTGALMTLGRGAIASSSRKQKINTRSSTETELIAVDDKLGDILWMRYFLEGQGYTITENIVYQDNMSTLSLEKNGRVSGSGRTKHIRAKYYLVKDKYETNEIDLKYCPTETMWADVLTKPLQGQQFRQMRSFLMNCPLDYCET